MQSRQSQEFYMHPRISKKTIFPSYIPLPVIEAPLKSPSPYSSSGYIPFCNKGSWDLSWKWYLQRSALVQWEDFFIESIFSWDPRETVESHQMNSIPTKQKKDFWKQQLETLLPSQARSRSLQQSLLHHLGWCHHHPQTLPALQHTSPEFSLLPFSLLLFWCSHTNRSHNKFNQWLVFWCFNVRNYRKFTLENRGKEEAGGIRSSKHPLACRCHRWQQDGHASVTAQNTNSPVLARARLNPVLHLRFQHHTVAHAHAEFRSDILSSYRLLWLHASLM